MKGNSELKRDSMNLVGDYEAIRTAFLNSTKMAVTENKKLRQFLDRGLYSWTMKHDQIDSVEKNKIPDSHSLTGPTDLKCDDNVIQLIATMTLQSLTIKEVAV